MAAFFELQYILIIAEAGTVNYMLLLAINLLCPSFPFPFYSPSPTVIYNITLSPLSPLSLWFRVLLVPLVYLVLQEKEVLG